MRGSREGGRFRSCAALARLCVGVCVAKSERVRRQEIARVARVGSTPRGAEREQREHLPPRQEQLFNPPRRGDAGMGGAAKAKKGARRSSTRLLFSFTCSPLQSLQTPTPHPAPTLSLYPAGLWRLMVSIFFFFFTFPLRQSLESTSCLRACTFEAEAPIFCAGGVQSAGSEHLGRRRLPRCFFFFNVYHLHVFVHVCMERCARV